MNYPELIWSLVEMLLQKEDNNSQKIDDIENSNQINAKEQNETT